MKHKVSSELITGICKAHTVLTEFCNYTENGSKQMFNVTRKVLYKWAYLDICSANLFVLQIGACFLSTFILIQQIISQFLSCGGSQYPASATEMRKGLEGCLIN